MAARARAQRAAWRRARVRATGVGERQRAECRPCGTQRRVEPGDDRDRGDPRRAGASTASAYARCTSTSRRCRAPTAALDMAARSLRRTRRAHRRTLREPRPSSMLFAATRSRTGATATAADTPHRAPTMKPMPHRARSTTPGSSPTCTSPTASCSRRWPGSATGSCACRPSATAPGMVVSEMVSSFGVHHGNEKTRTEMLRIEPAERAGGPVAIQLFGQEPDVMRSAAATDRARHRRGLHRPQHGLPGAEGLQDRRRRRADRRSRPRGRGGARGARGLGPAGHREDPQRPARRRPRRLRPRAPARRRGRRRRDRLSSALGAGAPQGLARPRPRARARARRSTRR